MAIAVDNDDVPVQVASRLSVSCTSLLTKTQRLVLGLLVLLMVDVIWVLSSELTEYIYRDAEYDKPFFTTYAKTSMFMIYLSGFIFWKPWRERCKSPQYQLFKDDIDNTRDNTAVLSGPVYVPVKSAEESDRASGNESDESHSRSVRFSRVAEVREMSSSEAADALLARLGYAASLRAEQATRCKAEKLSVAETMKLAALFSVLWFVGNYSYQAALSHTEAGVVNVLSSSSSLFTLLLASCLPSTAADKFTFSKLLAVMISFTGVILVSLSDRKIENEVPVGAGWALAGAICYATYLVLLRRKVDHEEKLDISMFFGFVGFFNTILLWPGFLLLHYSNMEVFEWPNQKQWTLIAINGLVGTVLSEFMWLWGCFLTSSLIATLAISLTIPLTMFADVVVKHVSYSAVFYIGAVPMFLSFFAVTLLAHYEDWDPVAALWSKVFPAFRRDRKRFSVPDQDEQREALIDQTSA